MAGVMIKARDYKLVVYKNPKVGYKPLHLVSFLTNSWFGEAEGQSRSRQPLTPIVVLCREFSLASDGANQMPLQLRMMTRQMQSTSEVATFMVRYMAANAFASLKAPRLVKPGITIWQLQSDIIRRRYFAWPKWWECTTSSLVVHAPVKVTGKQLCGRCLTTTKKCMCTVCNVPLYIKCFGPAHDA